MPMVKIVTEEDGGKLFVSRVLVVDISIGLLR
jgi:hypothetical protein